MRLSRVVSFSIAMTWIACISQTSLPANVTPDSSTTTTTAISVRQFDETRDAAADIKAAIAEARRTQKRILLYVGGDWCPYCGQMHELFELNPDLQRLRDSHFIVVPIAYGYAKSGDHALAAYSKVLGIPHFFVLDSDGKELQSQHLIELRSDGVYDPAKMKDFLVRWSGAAMSAQK
jgi:thioredoxin-related protein